jgi:hypothetical protein
MSTVDVDPWIRERLQPRFWCRNGMLVSAAYQGKLCELANQVVSFRVKEIASFGNTAQPTVYTNWTFAAHTSPKCATIVCRVLMAKSPSTSGAFAVVELSNEAGVMLVQKLIYAGVAIGETPVDSPDEWTEASAIIDARTYPNTKIYGRVYTLFTGDGGVTTGIYTGRIVGATIYELALSPDTDNGYLSQSYSAGQGIYEGHRGGLVETAIGQWKRGAAPLFTWSSERDSSAAIDSSGSGNYRNLIDDSTTTASNSSPGFWIDTRNCNTKSRADVPCRFAARVQSTGGNSSVRLVDGATGASIRTLTISGAFTGWVEGDTSALEPRHQKVDVQYRGDVAQTLTVYSACLYQYLA